MYIVYGIFFLFLNTDFVGSINTRNICLIFSTIYSFISVSVCIDRGLSALLWPGPILLIRRPWPYVIHHLHFMNMYRLYKAWYRPILLCMLVVLIDIFVIKLFTYNLKDHTFILQTPASTTYPLLNIMVDTTRVQVQVGVRPIIRQSDSPSNDLFFWKLTL
jgi:hypothetical protein